MTYQQIIEQTNTFTIEQKQQLAYFLLFSTISEEQRNEYTSLLYSKSDNKEVGLKKTRKLGFFPKGTFVMNDDFNKPLNDFAEYM